MAIQMRRGALADYDKDKMVAGELAVTTNADPDEQQMYVSFGPGVSKRLLTDDDEVVKELQSDVSENQRSIINLQSDSDEMSDTVKVLVSDTRTLKDKADSMDIDIGRKVDDAYVEDGVAYFTSDGEVLFSITGIGGGGGGGGGGTTSAVLTVTNTSGWITKTVSDGADCIANVTWSSIENEMPTGNGTMTIKVNKIPRATLEVQQGEVTVNLKQYLGSGANKVQIQITDVYDQSRSVNFNVTVISLSISSSFDTTITYEGPISFPYTPVGDVDKTVHFIVDGTQVGTVETSASNRQLTYALPKQAHGGHSLRVYFEATVNEQTVRSNELYYEFVALDGSNTPVIISQFNEPEQVQYATITIPYTVYTPDSLTSAVTITVNGKPAASLTVDRTEQTFSYRANEYGTHTVVIASGKASKTITIAVSKSDIDVEAETEDLALWLTAAGRSNNEEHPEVWKYENISATLSNFTFTSDGWQKDADGATILRVTGNDRVTIPYKIFENDFKAAGKTIELEFATRNVLNYDSVILSCMSGDRGLSVTAQKAMLKSEQSEISTQYKEDEHVRIAFVTQKRSENRLLFIYINGIASGVAQYPANDNFSQASPVNISIGSNDCTIDIYNIRVYDNSLTRFQVVNNWIADTQDGGTMLDRYTRNNVFDAYGNIVISQLQSDLPYLTISCEELPQSKGDKKTVSGTFVNPLNPSKGFTFNNCQLDVQGTSSQYYPRKNYKAKFDGGFIAQDGTKADKYAMSADSIPVKTFCFKADFASSEGANNVELVELYNAACPYKTPAQKQNSKVRQGIEGFPILIFWNNTATGSTTFIGKYNFNNDKSTEDVFGLSGDDESWETLNNSPGRAMWQSADFSGTAWQSDFEARYPDTKPAYTDTEQLASFAAWVVSTDPEQATGNTLPESVTYDGKTYTTDNAEYRVAKFRAEASKYMELDSALFYYLFTELFLMVDSRAKNAFPSFMGAGVSAE